MELIQIFWVIIFFFFALVLIFTWSKISIISRKISTIISTIDNIKKLENNSAAGTESLSENGKA